jgi:hypothetical protein
MAGKDQQAVLRAQIILLQDKQAIEFLLLKDQFHLSYEGLKPLIFQKSLFKTTIASPNFKKNILSTSVGLVAGYLSKLLFVNISPSPLRKILGTTLQFVITKFVAENPEGVTLVGKEILTSIRTKLTGKTTVESN